MKIPDFTEENIHLSELYDKRIWLDQKHVSRKDFSNGTHEWSLKEEITDWLSEYHMIYYARKDKFIIFKNDDDSILFTLTWI
jgi:hypothetical protein